MVEYITISLNITTLDNRLFSTRRKCIHQKVNQILAQLSEVHIQLLGLTNKREEFNYEFTP